MKNIEDSSFLQGVEGRLDSLFGVDDEKKNEKKDDNKETPEIDASKYLSTQKIETEALPPLPAKEDEGTDQSKFISEIEKRFNAIFGEDNKETKSQARSEAITKEQPTVEEIIAKAERAENNNIDQVNVKLPTLEEIIFKAEQIDSKKIDQSMPEQPTLEEIIFKVETADSKSIDQMPDELVSSSSVLYSPLKDIKSIILSLEWEIDSRILAQFDAEINKLQALNEGNYTILGFLLILRFLGRYIRVRGTDSNRGSITLLLSVYDNLEDVILTEDMSAENKRKILLEDIKNYREWVDQLDFDVSKYKSFEKQATPSFTGEKREPLPKETQAGYGGRVLPEPGNISKARESDTGIKEGHEIDYNVPNVLAAIKHMTPHEGIAYVAENFKKVISSEINALRTEIQRYNQQK
jgi:hypothetical protein